MSEDMTSTRPTLPRIAVLVIAAALAVLALPATGMAAVLTFGSPLSVSATMDTANNLDYTGVNTTVYGTGAVVHTTHDGADTALWNASIPGGTPAAPGEGQITSVTLEGCAQPASGGPAPLTQFHFQALTPTTGGLTVDVTTQPFDIPVCGVGGASGATATTYQPINFCVHQGDYVDFNDEGGFDPTYYPNGVPYEVIGSAPGSGLDSFVGDNQTNNGALLAFSTTGATNG